MNLFNCRNNCSKNRHCTMRIWEDISLWCMKRSHLVLGVYSKYFPNILFRNYWFNSQSDKEVFACRDLFVTPMYDIDVIWHTHQLHPVAYAADMTSLLGYVMNHDDSDQNRNSGSKLSNVSLCFLQNYLRNKFLNQFFDFVRHHW